MVIKTSLIRGISLVFLSVAILGSSYSFAGGLNPLNSQEKWGEIAQSKQVKLKTVNWMKKQIEQHEKMSVEQIRHQLTQLVLAKREQAQAQGDLTTPLIQAFDSTIRSIEQIQDRDSFILEEKMQLQNLVESENLCFGLTRATVGLDMGLVALIIFTVPIDIVILPITFIASLVTGF